MSGSICGENYPCAIGHGAAGGAQSVRLCVIHYLRQYPGRLNHGSAPADASMVRAQAPQPRLRLS